MVFQEKRITGNSSIFPRQIRQDLYSNHSHFGFIYRYLLGNDNIIPCTGVEIIISAVNDVARIVLWRCLGAPLLTRLRKKNVVFLPIL